MADRGTILLRFKSPRGFPPLLHESFSGNGRDVHGSSTCSSKRNQIWSILTLSGVYSPEELFATFAEKWFVHYLRGSGSPRWWKGDPCRWWQVELQINQALLCKRCTKPNLRPILLVVAALEIEIPRFSNSLVACMALFFCLHLCRGTNLPVFWDHLQATTRGQKRYTEASSLHYWW